jgi:hypothetical protein
MPMRKQSHKSFGLRYLLRLQMLSPQLFQPKIQQYRQMRSQLLNRLSWQSQQMSHCLLLSR